MRKLNYLIPLIIIISLCLFSCKKDDKEPNTVRERIVNKSWMLTNLKIGVNGTTTDFTAFLPYIFSSYVLDNVQIFYNDGSYEYNEGATKELPDDPQVIYTGTWMLSENEDTLTISTSQLGLEEYHIVSASSAKLELSVDGDIYNLGTSGQDIITFFTFTAI